VSHGCLVDRWTCCTCVCCLSILWDWRSSSPHTLACWVWLEYCTSCSVSDDLCIVSTCWKSSLLKCVECCYLSYRYDHMRYSFTARSCASAVYAEWLCVRPLVCHKSVCVCIMFSGFPSSAFVHSFVLTDLVTTISRERLEQSRRNLRGIFTSPCLCSV